MHVLFCLVFGGNFCKYRLFLNLYCFYLAPYGGSIAADGPDSHIIGYSFLQIPDGGLDGPGLLDLYRHDLLLELLIGRILHLIALASGVFLPLDRHLPLLSFDIRDRRFFRSDDKCFLSAAGIRVPRCGNLDRCLASFHIIAVPYRVVPGRYNLSIQNNRDGWFYGFPRIRNFKEIT